MKDLVKKIIYIVDIIIEKSPDSSSNHVSIQNKYNLLTFRKEMWTNLSSKIM